MIREMIAALGLSPQAILLTHAHPDHIGALSSLAGHYRIPTYLHSAEQPMLEYAPAFAMLLGLGAIAIPARINYFDSQSLLSLSNFEVEIIFTPGHSPGSVCYRLADKIFTGDTLFKGGVGRVDLPGGSYPQLQNSLRQLYRLPEELQVYPGHGPATDLGSEKLTNPYFLELMS